MKAFDELKMKLITTPVVQRQNWAIAFELMCDASDKGVWAVLGQRPGRVPHVICYAS